MKQNKKYAICPACGNEFHKRRSSSIYCCSACQAIGRRKRTIVVCDECGKEFERVDCHVRKHNFCSVECRSKWQVGNTAEEKSTNWNGGTAIQNGYVFLRQGKKNIRHSTE